MLFYVIWFLAKVISPGEIRMPRYLLTRKFERFTRLSKDDCRALEAIIGAPVQFEAREDVVREGDYPDHVNLVVEGWLCRYKQLEDGRRQITALMLPGDMCDIFVLDRMDHSIGTLTAAKVSAISRLQVEAIAADHPRLNRTLWWDMLLTAAIQREWTVNLGQRTAFERVGHLFCELFTRLKTVGLADGSSFALPITQADLANALGLSVVHMNRTLQDLRRSGLIVLKGRVLTIPDVAALKTASMFDPNYLHLEHEGRRYDADEAEAS